MYVLNADIKDLLSFSESVQSYLVKNNVPFLTRVGDTLYFAKSRLLKKTIGVAPEWVKKEAELGR